jgi:tetratricopeptide (TPR) repeat protein/2-polyprenyl-3-methyl-5-hydroxy-6-metoxy-1,4-benzoquinol methylase
VGEKKRRLAAGIASPRFDERLIAQALSALQRADRRAAESAFAAIGAQPLPPSDAEALHAIGFIALQLQRDEAALDALARATALDANNAAYRCHLAIACRRVGDTDRAVTELRAALRIDPSLAEAHSNLGNVLLEQRELDEALASFRRALALRADYPEALNGVGEAELGLGHFEAACASLDRAVALDPTYHEAWYNRSRAHALREASAPDRGEARAGDGGPTHAALALESILVALGRHRDNPAYWTQFERCAARFDLRHPGDPHVRDVLAAALAHPAVDPARLVRPIVSLVVTHPDVTAVEREFRAGRFDAVEPPRRERAARAVFEDALMQRLLDDVVVPNAFIECSLAFARRTLLNEVLGASAQTEHLTLSAIVALAQQGFNGEYAAEETTEERAALATLRQAIDAARAAGGPLPQRRLAVYACYRSLGTLDGSDRIAEELGSGALRALAIRQIVEPLAERRIATTIAASTPAVDAVSTAVRSQYEEHPYPRWQRVRVDAKWASLDAMLHQRFPDTYRPGALAAPERILVAGCGTGRQPIATARRFPCASILAVDLSVASLAYALRKTRELAIANIEYRHADLLALGALTERFDAIECTGVLHHLHDPLSGWRTLAALLRPGGVMLVGLYSTIARRHVARARELIAARGYLPTADGIRAFRRDVLARCGDPLCARLARGEDFYSVSGVRDLAFHVQEHRFTLPEIGRMLVALGLRLIGFDLSEWDVALAYHARFPDDRAAIDVDHWHAFEQSRPDTFAQMYQFWVQKPLAAATGASADGAA